MIYNEDEVCDICLSGEFNSDNQIVFCDICNCTVHQACYGINNDELAADCWFCWACAQQFEGTCFLCGFSLRGYSSKEYVIIGRPAAPKFVHCLCFRIFPSLSYCPDEKTIQVSAATHLRLEAMRTQQKRRPCLRCAHTESTSDGIVISCRAPTRCTETYHPLCLILAGGGIWEEGFETYDVIHALCPTHISCNWVAWRQNKVTGGTFENAMAEVQNLLLNHPMEQTIQEDSAAVSYNIGAHAITIYNESKDSSFAIVGFYAAPHLETDSIYPFTITSYHGKTAEPYPLMVHEAALLTHIQISSQLTKACPRCIKTEKDLRIVDDNALVTALEHQFSECVFIEDIMVQSLASLSLADTVIFTSLCLIPGVLSWRDFMLKDGATREFFKHSNAQLEAVDPCSHLFAVPCLELFLAVLQRSIIIFFVQANTSDNFASAFVLRPPLAISGRNIILRK